MKAVTLHNAEFTAEILPDPGAIVRSLVWHGPRGDQPLLHPLAGTPARDSTAARHGLWPMVPFANRAFGARLLLPEGGSLALPANDGDGGAMHGFGWQHGWAVAAQGADSLTLGHAYERADPYCYIATFSITFAPGRVRFDLSVTNTGARALPFGLGLHPWFPRGPETRLRLAAEGALRLGPGYRATGHGPLATGEDYAEGRLLPAETAVSFTGWHGPALLEDAVTGLSLAIDAASTLRHPVLWTPAGAPFVCLEPQSHGIGAVSEPAARAATPLRLLAPGETLAGWMTLTPR